MIRPDTHAVWGGETTSASKGAIATPIYTAVAFGFDDIAQWEATASGAQAGYTYSRGRNPTVEVLEEKLRVLEGGEAATSFASGMAAISSTLFALLVPGDRVVTLKDTYGGSNNLFTRFLPRLNVDVALCDTDDMQAIEREMAAGCQVLYLESPTNPAMKIVDIRRLCAAAHALGAVVVIDNTFSTPINQRPLALGVDIVVYSATKFLNGHSDALGGMAVGRSDLIEPIRAYREATGSVLHPHTAYMILRGMKTLALRMQRHNDNALRIARFLEQHPAIAEVNYPGLERHPQHALAQTQMTGFGGILSFVLNGCTEHVATFLTRLKWAHRAGSLGAVETLVGIPSTTSHAELDAEGRAKAGVPDTLIRYSAGIEDPDDLLADLAQALDGLGIQTPS